MCLLVKQPEGVEFSPEWIANFHSRNKDGFGYMYAENNTLYYNKIIGGVDAVKEVYRQVAGKKAVLHFRMATHGTIQPINSHPYPILTSDDGYPLFLAHNGVLSCGNGGDAKKSDTRYYIETFLRPILLENNQLWKLPAFKKMVESHIGVGNKFIMMDAYGHIEIFNETAGTEWEANPGKPKAWMSNTYAWDAQRAGVGYQGYQGRGGYQGFGYDNDYEFTPPTSSRRRRKAANATGNITPFVGTKTYPNWARDFATDFFKAINGTYYRAWQVLQYDDLHKFAERVGEKDAHDFIADIKAGLFTAEQIIDIVDIVNSGMDVTINKATEEVQKPNAPDNTGTKAEEPKTEAQAATDATAAAIEAQAADDATAAAVELQASVKKAADEMNAAIEAYAATSSFHEDFVKASRLSPGEVFVLLKASGYTQAWASLNIPDVDRWVKHADAATYDKLIEDVKAHALTEEQVFESIFNFQAHH